MLHLSGNGPGGGAARVPVSSMLNNTHQPVDYGHMTTENGRTYNSWSKSKYPYPCDDDEKIRLDLMDCLIYSRALRDNYILTDKRQLPRRARVLDVGCGTGMWALNMGEILPEAQVTGIDLAPIQPQTKGSNVTFRTPIDFETDQWPVEAGSIDLVHMAQLCGSVQEWPALYQKAFRHLRPGTGQIELVEIDWKPFCTCHDEDSSAHHQTAYHTWWDYMKRVTGAMGKSIEYREDTEQLLRRAGYLDRNHRVQRIDFYESANDRFQRSITEMFRTTMGDKPSKPFSGLCMALFTQHGWTPQQVERFGEDIIDLVNLKGNPFYINLHFWTARRPA